MEVPICPDPAHSGSRVTRAGWYGTKPHRRQRWWCDPQSGPRHRFTELFPRQETESCECRACRTRLEPWEGPITPRTYAFPEEQIAYALVRLAQGGTYRGISFDVRRHAQRELASSAPGATPTRAEGVLIANWLDIYADVVTAPDRINEWPKIIAIDSAAQVVAGGLSRGRRFHVLGANGYAGPSAKPQVVLFEPSPYKTQAAWESFLRLLPGAPEIVVSDIDAGIAAAVAAVFPDAEHRWSEYHLKKSVANALPEELAKPCLATMNAVLALRDEEETPLAKAFRVAFTSPERWDEFVDLIDASGLGPSRLRAVHGWISRYTARIYEQTKTRSRGPHSTGGIETVLDTVGARLNRRSHRMTNRARLRRLLALVAADLNGQANQQEWLDRIHDYVTVLGGRAPAQGKAHDPKGAPTLLAPAGRVP